MNTPTPRPQQTQSSGIHNVDTASSDYGTAKAIAQFISILGWFVFTGGGIAAVAGISGGVEIPFGNRSPLLTALPGIAISVLGLILTAAGQVTKATVDNANYTREILELLRRDGRTN